MRASGLSLRVGTDVVAIADVQRALDAFGTRYTERIFTAHEVAASGGLNSPTLAAHLAARFAAKEAVLKVLRPADVSPPWRSIEIVRQPGGWCDVELVAEAARMAENEQLCEIEVSLSHDAGVGLATVMARRCPEGDPAR